MLAMNDCCLEELDLSGGTHICIYTKFTFTIFTTFYTKYINIIFNYASAWSQYCVSKSWSAQTVIKLY